LVVLQEREREKESEMRADGVCFAFYANRPTPTAPTKSKSMQTAFLKRPRNTHTIEYAMYIPVCLPSFLAVCDVIHAAEDAKRGSNAQGIFSGSDESY
jgi:hypothetical protein